MDSQAVWMSEQCIKLETKKLGEIQDKQWASF